METSLRPMNIAVLLHNSLLSVGIASRLKEQVDEINLNIIDSDDPNIAGVLSTQAPEIIILDAGDHEICQKIGLARLFEWAPGAKIIRLDLSSEIEADSHCLGTIFCRETMTFLAFQAFCIEAQAYFTLVSACFKDTVFIHQGLNSKTSLL